MIIVLIVIVFKISMLLFYYFAGICSMLLYCSTLIGGLLSCDLSRLKLRMQPLQGSALWPYQQVLLR